LGDGEVTEVRAADLPAGSIVATRDDAWIKREHSHGAPTPWDATGSRWCIEDATMDELIAEAGAAVLRHGCGEDLS
jgi:hypothetical protein